ncbi:MULTISPECIES: cysteine desulfurase family protein [Pontibacillus]|uniref:Cysteine desulfurase family protein n=1 Tax=Pontibacillus chungwhensis TaxID=265426 RepID=A0ABY8V5W0_9BACI|nr:MULTISPECIES: cysteine desulfurase family protein [Pontibacillus]MCD5323872.1 cysteine desulfurase [Pontibacillus sp. HN14]WIG00230.1 cysteine desulfurase family protein [Pontibacillus chungwhensis]
MIYFDNSATTKPYPEVLNSFQQVSERYYGNPSSIHAFGSEAERLLQQSKKQASGLLGIHADEVVFTSGGTEGNNMAIKGIALQHQNRGKHIITTTIEHPSVLEACRSLESLGFEVTYLPVNGAGRISVEDVQAAIREDTILISVMHVNNELGTIQPIEEIANVARQHPKLYFHVDYVQGLGKIDLDLSRIDLCTMSSHKVHGLKGTGILYVKRNTSLFPLLHGGSQEASYRAGTENLPGIVSMVKALRMTKENQKQKGKHLRELHQQLYEEISKFDEVVMNTPSESAPHIVNFSVPGFKPEVVIHALGERGIYISTKSACSSKHADESAVLTACGHSHERSSAGLRVSITYDNTMEEGARFIRVLREVLTELKEVMG